jgi:peptidoglycan/LPS O-acetylase OafA/YrhL
VKGIKYLPHIDGMRAIAVISVLVFHLESSYLPGGFLGVDIFFVISGFLITKIIYNAKLENSFSYLQFYEKRIRRIIPALYTTLLLVFISAYFILLPYEYYKNAISMVGALLFVSNYQFSLRTGDYFSGNAEEWPLLHTWSLSVEEQYYFLIPILFIFLLKIRQKNYINLSNVNINWKFGNS